MEKPTVYTIKGTLPEEILQYQHQWTITDDEIKLEEFWYLDGEIVRNNCHIYGKKPVQMLQSNDVTIGLEGVGIGGQQAEMR